MTTAPGVGESHAMATMCFRTPHKIHHQRVSQCLPTMDPFGQLGPCVMWHAQHHTRFVPGEHVPSLSTRVQATHWRHHESGSTGSGPGIAVPNRCPAANTAPFTGTPCARRGSQIQRVVVGLGSTTHLGLAFVTPRFPYERVTVQVADETLFTADVAELIQRASGTIHSLILQNTAVQPVLMCNPLAMRLRRCAVLRHLEIIQPLCVVGLVEFFLGLPRSLNSLHVWLHLDTTEFQLPIPITIPASITTVRLTVPRLTSKTLPTLNWLGTPPQQWQMDFGNRCAQWQTWHFCTAPVP